MWPYTMLFIMTTTHKIKHIWNMGLNIMYLKGRPWGNTTRSNNGKYNIVYIVGHNNNTNIHKS